jgi:CubicO group peptidase (beta-lactamase class C family)
MTTIPGDVLRQLPSMLDDLAVADRFSGTVLVRMAAGRFILSRGTADRQAVTRNGPATRFNTASITKLFTAVAACRLSEAGALDLHAPISSWISPGELAAVERVTPHHLLNHTAGFPEEIPDPELPLAGRAGGGWIAPLRGLQPLFPPGTAWQYSNAGYAILGEIIERITGEPYFDAIERLVLHPAGMTASGFEDTSTAAAGRAIGYQLLGDDGAAPGLDNRDSGLGRGAPFGYASSTVEDLERLIDAIVSRRIVDDVDAARILHGAAPTGEAARFAGYGMFRERAGGTDIVTTAGAGPGISAWLDAVPGANYLVIVLSNYPKPAAHHLGRLLRSLAFSG